jgi:p-aminobenzoyl-glutamate transporter AbgT
MDRQEKHQQKKEQEREAKNNSEQAYETEQQKRRLPINSIAVVLVGMLLVFAVIYVWTVGMARPW